MKNTEHQGRCESDTIKQDITNYKKRIEINCHISDLVLPDDIGKWQLLIGFLILNKIGEQPNQT